MTALAEAIVYCAAVYLSAGAVVAVLFLAFGVARIDDAAKGAGFFFRPAIFSGCAVLWPFIILRWLSGKKINQPIEGEE